MNVESKVKRGVLLSQTDSSIWLQNRLVQMTVAFDIIANNTITAPVEIYKRHGKKELNSKIRVNR